MSLIDFAPGAYGAMWFLTAKGIYGPMMRRNLNTYNVGKWCRYHGTYARDWGSQQCCGTRKENESPFRPWAVASFSLVVALVWPLIWIIALIMFDPRHSRMRYLGQDKNGNRVSVSSNTTQADIDKLEKALGMGKYDAKG